MATLNVRNLPDRVRALLRLRAARAGRSMEAEAREILTNVCREQPPAGADELQSFVDKLYRAHKPRRVVEDLIEERRREAERE